MDTSKLLNVLDSAALPLAMLLLGCCIGYTFALYTW